jgi:hypothetical protein
VRRNRIGGSEARKRKRPARNVSGRGAIVHRSCPALCLKFSADQENLSLSPENRCTSCRQRCDNIALRGYGRPHLGISLSPKKIRAGKQPAPADTILISERETCAVRFSAWCTRVFRPAGFRRTGSLPSRRLLKKFVGGYNCLKPKTRCGTSLQMSSSNAQTGALTIRRKC